MTLPRIGFEINSYVYAPSRKLQSTLRNVYSANRFDPTVSAQYVPVPYDIMFSLSIFTKNSEDGAQIVEQILPYFRPEFTVALNLIPEMNMSVDVPVTLVSTAPSEIYEGDFETRSAWTFDMEFSMKGYFYGPVVNKGVITRDIINFKQGVANNALTIEQMTINSSNTVSINAYGYGF